MHINWTQESLEILSSFKEAGEFNELEPGSQLFLLPPARGDNTELGFVFPSHFWDAQIKLERWF